MLRSLTIRDMLLVERLELDFRPGLNVLTGETGAGKSILLDCLGFVLGWRGRADVVRAGAAKGEVEAIFDLPADHPGHAVLEEAGIELEPGEELVLRRQSTAEGRRSNWINDRRASAETLKSLAETLVELHGQHDDRGLLDPKGHRQLLDQFAGAAPLLAEIRSLWAKSSAARRDLAAREAGIEALKREEDFLRHAVAELEALSPEPGEDEALDTRRRFLQSAARLAGDVSKAGQALGESGAERALIDAQRWLEGASEGVEGRLDSALEALSRAMDALGEAQQGVESCLEAMGAEPGELERVEERLFALRGLARKHGVAPDDLGAHAAALRARLDALDGGAGDLVKLSREAEAARAAHLEASKRLSLLRTEAAGRLDKAVAAELAPLKMERAVFRTVIAASDPGPEGADAVSFEVSTNPGAPSGALNRIASGGELSRFLLALKVSLSGGEGATLIFDEIDRGVGGATADAVGRRLEKLAEGGQVLVVTHSPQVAARGASHFRVAKQVLGEADAARTTSNVMRLSAEERIDEIARMLAGDTITPAARAAAESLIAG